MQIGMVGLGRMGGNMVRRLMRSGHDCVAYDVSPDNVAALVSEGATGSASLADLVGKLDAPRTVWLMVPAALTSQLAREIAALLSAGDTIVDGGNSYYREAVDLSREFAGLGIDFIDVGTSGGVWGLERGFCLMIGGAEAAVKRLDPIFASLAPGAAGPLDGAVGTAPAGYLHCGPSGAGHFVKMVHNGIEYGVMAAFAEGFNVLDKADAGTETRTTDAETAPLSEPEYYQYDFDIAAVAEVWRHSSVISSWLLDLTAETLLRDPKLDNFAGNVSDSGEGRWTLKAAIETGVPVPVLSSALFQRFSSRGNDEFANKMISAMRYAFGGHHEKPGG
ncbi:decarboxylating 6-phosphogluconate dehydrogenase [Devosia sp. PTR5]|uniref:Decarboxylating 6-phosphogluconate dehydrogenase n=1 Tax=Devosia oryzisoli TaxID=2774138 RepID=A0A927ITF4_9HYPH|nr:decarboxylating 6-phosphogluconate dehydrogenase [Devosia oryzisoli]MBD8065822.1 decarboxylating 6-phosphogluconate dehydrogenase [Devosia oryzisoli]